MTGRPWTPWPQATDIVDCKFPQQGFAEAMTPGPKERPALVLAAEDSPDDANCCVVTVSYATSQNTTKVYPGEFVITAGGKTGLTKDTKFDLTRKVTLPFDDTWFGPAVGSSPAHPKRGVLDIASLAVKRKLLAALGAAQEVERKRPKS